MCAKMTLNHFFKIGTLLKLAPLQLEKALRVNRCGLPNIRKAPVWWKIIDCCPSTSATPDMEVLLIHWRRKHSLQNTVSGSGNSIEPEIWEADNLVSTYILSAWSQVVIESHLSSFCERANASRPGTESQKSSALPSLASALLKGAEILKDFTSSSDLSQLLLLFNSTSVAHALSPSKPHKC